MPPSFHQVMNEHGPALARIVGSYARRPADRQDLHQDVCLAVWQALPRFRGESSLRTFLFRIAHNRGLRFVARQRARGLPGAPTHTDPPDQGPDPETHAASRERSRQLLRAIHRLPLGQRQVLTLALEGLPHREIGEILGITENNAAVRLHRARAALRTALEDPHG